VPDFYQGTELWDFSLVDPDNRRAVDYDRRRALLAELDAACERDGRAAVASRLLEAGDDGVKLFAMATMLRFRKDERVMFEQGGYRALEAQGSQGDHVFAFARTHGDRQVLVAVPRLVATLTSESGVRPLGERVWNDTRLDLTGLAGARGYRDVITGRCVPVRTDGASALRVADVFDRFPIAMLISEPS